MKGKKMAVIVECTPMPKTCDECVEMGFTALDGFICWGDEQGRHCPLKEVVRCKDCTECETRETANYLTFLFCTLNQHSVAKHAFCCWGRKRSE